MLADDEEIAARRIGEVLGSRFRLERLLGTGGMAAVYAASDAHGRAVAVKVMHPELSLRRDVRERFLREAYACNEIDHPGVCRVLEHGEDGERSAFLVMELLEGESLGAAVRRLGTVPLEKLLDYADQILDVLAAAHGRGIIHRDLKPDNLFLTPGGGVKVLDFGVARVRDGAPGELRTQTGLALGTLPYMAPEQALGRRGEVDGRVDLFALGATLFRVLSGRRIHDAPSEAELLIAMATRPAPRLASVAPGVSPDVCLVVDVALAFSSSDRYPDARTMQADVRAVRSGLVPPFASQALARREDRTRTELDAPTAARRGAAAASAGPDAPTRVESVHASGLPFEPTLADFSPEPAAREATVAMGAAASGANASGASGAPAAWTAVNRAHAASGPPPLQWPSSSPEAIALPAPPRTGFTRPPFPLRRALWAGFLSGAGLLVALAVGALLVLAARRWLTRDSASPMPALPAIPAGSARESPAPSGTFGVEAPEERAATPPRAARAVVTRTAPASSPRPAEPASGEPAVSSAPVRSAPSAPSAAVVSGPPAAGASATAATGSAPTPPTASPAAPAPAPSAPPTPSAPSGKRAGKPGKGGGRRSH